MTSQERALLAEYFVHYRTADARGAMCPVVSITPEGREESSFLMPASERTGLAPRSRSSSTA